MPSYRLRRLSSSAFLNFRSVSSFSVFACSALSSLSSRFRSAARWAAPCSASLIFLSSSSIWLWTSPTLFLRVACSTAFSFSRSTTWNSRWTCFQGRKWSAMIIQMIDSVIAIDEIAKMICSVG